MTVRPSMAERIARHNQDNALREHEENERVRRAVEHMRTQEEFRKWKEKMGFNMYLTATQLLMVLTCQRDMNAPKHPDDEWSEEFRQAVELIPEVRQFYEDMAMECTEVNNNVVR